MTTASKLAHTDHRRFGGRTNSVRGLGIPMNYIVDCARALDQDDARAVMWLAGYARLLDRTADSFSAEMDMEPRDIRSLLTNPDAEPEKRALFTGAVALLQAEFSEWRKATYSPENNPFPHQSPFHQALGKMAKTSVTRATRKAVEFAEAGGWAVVNGLERMGKTVTAADLFLDRLDRAAWVRLPSGDSGRSFLDAVATACGVPCGDKGTIARILRSLGEVLGPGKIETLFLDQFHAILPVNAKRAYPHRLELLMDLLDGLGVNIVGIATPQWANQMEVLGTNGRYRDGQAKGRMHVFDLPEVLTLRELEDIAASRAPELSPANLDMLARHAQRDRGYCGTLTATIVRYRQLAAQQGKRPATMSDEDWRSAALASAIQERAKGAGKGGK